MASLAEISVRFSTNLREFSTKMQNATRDLAKVGRQMQSTGRKATTGITIPLIAAAGAAAKLGLEFDDNMTKIQTLVGVSADKVKGFRQEVLKLSGSTSKAPVELSNALFTVTSAGLRGAEALEVLESSAKASAVGLGDTREVARATTAVIQAYGKENITAAKAADILTATVREGNLEASELAPVLGRVIGLSSQLGISFEEVGASIATFTRLGVDSAEAVTGLRGVMNTLIKPTGQAEAALSRYGLSVADLRDQIKQKGLAVTLIRLVKTFKGNEEALASIIPNVRALSAVLGTAGAQGKEYQRIVQSLTNSQGLLDEAFEETSKTAGFKLRKALTDLKVVGTQFGDVILPVLADLSKRISGMLSGLKSLNPETKRTVIQVAAMAATIGPAVFVVGKMITTIYAASKAIRVFSLALSASPIGLAVAGITALALAFGAFRVTGNAFAETSKAVSTSLGRQKVEVENLVSAINDQETSEKKRLKLLDELDRKYPNFLKGLDKEKVTTEQLKNRLTEFNREFEKKIALQAAEEKLKENVKKQADTKAELSQVKEQLKTEEGRIDFLSTIFGTREEVAKKSQEQLDAYLADAIPQLEARLSRFQEEYKQIRNSYDFDILSPTSEEGEEPKAFEAVKKSLIEITKAPLATTILPALKTMQVDMQGVNNYTKEAARLWGNWNQSVVDTMTVMEEVTAGALTGIGDIFAQTFNSMLDGTKVTVGGIVKEIGRMIIKLAAAAAAAAALRTILGDPSAATSGAKAGSGIARLLAGFSNGMGFGGSRASGGPVTAGLQYIGGEHSKGEVFIPSQNGRIFPISKSSNNNISKGINIKLVGEFRQQGSDMVAVINQSLKLNPSASALGVTPSIG